MTEVIPEPSQLEATRLEQHGVAVLVLEGEIDIATVGVLDEALEEAVGKTSGTLILDLIAVGFIDSTGLRSILSTIAELTEEDRAMALVCGEGPVRRLIELTALTGRLAIFETRDAALETARSAAAS